MAKNAAGRNDPCPCGSGKKYKKCCWGKDPVVRESAPTPSGWDRLPPAERAQIEVDVDRLDDLSNEAGDAIKGRRYEEAEKICQELLREYPEIIDGHHRLGMLRHAQGRFQEAADHFTKVVAMIEEHPEGFDPQVPEMFRQRRDEALSKAKPQA
jgi:tetratricopeptide (TPR) repeat protein